MRRVKTTQEIYEAACKKYTVMPCTALLDQLDNGDAVICLRHKTLGPHDIRPIAVALVVSKLLKYKFIQNPININIMKN